jgi:hypothetical protein
MVEEGWLYIYHVKLCCGRLYAALGIRRRLHYIGAEAIELQRESVHNLVTFVT